VHTHSDAHPDAVDHADNYCIGVPVTRVDAEPDKR
jgi:hypothetical protein